MRERGNASCRPLYCQPFCSAYCGTVWGTGKGNKDFGSKYNILIRLRGNIFSHIFINIVLVRMVTIIAFSVKRGIAGSIQYAFVRNERVINYA